jgi:hypothetical protein
METQFVSIENDSLIYCKGRLAWCFFVDRQIFWVTRPEYFTYLPSFEALSALRIQDRHRLWQWLEARKRGKAVMHSTPCWGTDPNWGPYGYIGPTDEFEDEHEPLPPEPKPRYHPQYDPVQYESSADAHEKAEREKQKRADELNKTRRQKEIGVSIDRRRRAAWREQSRYEYRRPKNDKEAAGAGIAIFLDDHHYIEAMFELYSQCRYRLM